jgi:alkylation response protein AidB-like acyl-CoA dehydrogenase
VVWELGTSNGPRLPDTENQVILRDSAREFFAGECPMAFVRRAAESATAYDPQLWAQLAAQGYTGIIFDEAHGGVVLGIVELVLLMEEAGRALLPGPLFATVAMAGAVTGAPRRRRRCWATPRSIANAWRGWSWTPA